jgi:hypothetical protein
MFCKMVLVFSVILYSRLVGSSVRLEREVFAHHGWVAGLEAEARAGCHLCALLVASVEGERGAPYVLVVTVQGELGVEVEGRSLRRVVLTLISSMPLDEAEMTVGLLYTGSLGIGELGRRWLKDCLSLHVRCPPRSSTLAGFLPTRLIKLTAEAGVVKSARLVRGADVATCTRYLTLSLLGRP